jgi:hypothetical protein
MLILPFRTGTSKCLKDTVCKWALIMDQRVPCEDKALYIILAANNLCSRILQKNLTQGVDRFLSVIVWCAISLQYENGHNGT